MFIFEHLLAIRYSYYVLWNRPRREKPCLGGFANNKGTDQPAYPRSLISAFIVRSLESFIYTLATSEILIF